MQMAKKKPYVFTIGFDETNLSHVRAAEILNGTKKKASLIAAAVLSYVDGTASEKISELSQEALQPFLETLIRKELENIMGEQKSHEGRMNDSREVFDISLEDEDVPIDENITQNIVDAIEAFRKN